MTRYRRWTVGIVVLGVAAGVGWYAYGRKGPVTPSIVTAQVTAGSVIRTITATGALQPVRTVSVGTQVSGTVSWLGADFNSIVRKGQVIAKLDPSLLQAQVDQARASLTKANADFDGANVTLADAQAKLTRAQTLSANGLLAQTDLETAALAASSAKSAVITAQAGQVQARASLEQMQLNLAHATILAPIDGIVTERNVDVGQTVAASLEAPTLFIIASDLKTMEVNADVDESDIGALSEGQPAAFNVSAYPQETFVGVVAEVHLQPVIVQNVTTYNTIIDVPNDAGKLKPGMTASVTIETARKDGVIRIPNAALRFRPTAEMLAAVNHTTMDAVPTASGRARPADGGSTDAVLASFDPSGTAKPKSSAPGVMGRVWLLKDGQLVSTPVRTGVSDSANTELVDGAIPAGTALVTSVSTDVADKAPAVPANIFTGAGRGGRGR